MTADPHTLAGAYVLEAISGPERSRFEAHLAGCTECREEIRELREATARLGVAAAARPRPELRAQTIRAARRISQLAPVTDDRTPADGGPARRGGRAGARAGRAARERWTARRGLAAAAAVALIAAGTGLGVAMHHTMQQLHHTQRDDRLIAAVLAAPDAVLRSARISTGGVATVVLSHREHMGVFTAHHLRPLPAAESYELWLMGPRGERPAGMIKPASGGMAGPAVISGMAAGDMIGLTVEPAAGSPHPTSPPLVMIGSQGS